jgi:hypothetical protein
MFWIEARIFGSSIIGFIFGCSAAKIKETQMNTEGELPEGIKPLLQLTIELGDELQKKLGPLSRSDQALAIKEVADHYSDPLLKTILIRLADRLNGDDVKVKSLPFKIILGYGPCGSCSRPGGSDGSKYYDGIGGSVCDPCY